MTKENLDPNGIANKLNYLYDQSDSYLETEAAAIQLNFMSWLHANFIITSDQEGFLSSLDNTSRSFLADNCALAVKYRVDIVYTPLDAPAQVKASKRLDIKNNIFTSIHPSGLPSIQGTVEIIAAI